MVPFLLKKSQQRKTKGKEIGLKGKNRKSERRRNGAKKGLFQKRKKIF
jgi:hypothetical protein